MFQVFIQDSCVQWIKQLSIHYTHTHTHTHTHSNLVTLEHPNLEQQRNKLIVNINKAKNELNLT